MYTHTKSLLLGAAFLGLVALPVQADGIIGFIALGGGSTVLNLVSSGVGTITLMPPATVEFSPSFSGLDPVVTWQNTGQTIDLADLGTNSDLPCGTDCLLTVGAAEFHVNSITSIAGGVGLPFSTFSMSGIGTLIWPGAESTTDNFQINVGNRGASFVFVHNGVPGPIVGVGLPGLLFAALGLFGWWRLKNSAGLNL